jgi:hypothetical protein
MSITKLPNDNAFEILFGEPPLWDGEDNERYQALRTAIVDELKPTNVFEWINVRDQVGKLWEESRYKHAATALIQGGLGKTVQHYLKEGGHVFFDKLIDKYHNGGDKGRKEVMAALAKSGITIAELRAKAAQLEGAGLAMFEEVCSLARPERTRHAVAQVNHAID